jgi:pilus assembly protein CpaB
MRLTRQAALAIALVCGLLAAILLWVYISRQSKPVAKTPEAIEVPVPIKTIPAQVDLQPAMFKKASFERAKLPANSVTTDQAFSGRVSLVELVQDEPVRAEQIAIRSKQLGLAYSMRDGQRAMSVALDVVGAVADFVQPGNRVDVLVSFQREGRVVVRTIVQDVLVLAAGLSTSATFPTQASAGAAADKTAPDKTANAKRPDIPFTLAVTPNQAQVILTADVAGDLRLLLRPMGDAAVVPLPTSNSWSLIGPLPSNTPAGSQTGAPAAPAPPAPAVAPGYYGPQGSQAWGGAPTQPPPPTPRRPSVEVIRGGQREIVTPD